MLYLVIWILFVISGGLLILGCLEAQRERLSATRRKRLKALTKTLMVGAVGILGVMFCFAALTEVVLGLCGDEVSEQISSPDGAYTAYAFTRDCGAADHYGAPNVMLRDRSHPLQLKNGTIVGRSDWLGHDINDVVYHGEVEALKWMSNTELRIILTADSLGSGDTVWNGVKISYSRPHRKNH